jgi:hypothetical protein
MVGAELFPSLEKHFFSAAMAAGELTWQQGLLTKGCSLCHGTAGNGYLLHALYRGCLRQSLDETKEWRHWADIAEMWRARAWIFARQVAR